MQSYFLYKKVEGDKVIKGQSTASRALMALQGHEYNWVCLLVREHTEESYAFCKYWSAVYRCV